MSTCKHRRTFALLLKDKFFGRVGVEVCYTCEKPIRLLMEGEVNQVNIGLAIKES